MCSVLLSIATLLFGYLGAQCGVFYSKKGNDSDDDFYNSLIFMALNKNRRLNGACFENDSMFVVSI